MKEQVREALNVLMKACNLRGESGSEVLLNILGEAVDTVDWKIIDDSHEEGLCYDVTWLLAEAIVNARIKIAVIEEGNTIRYAVTNS